MPLLECDKLTVGYDSPLCSPLSFELRRGQILQVKGPNGSGKTTFLKTVLNILEPVSGRYHWLVAADELSYLPQIQNQNVHFSYNFKEILDLYDVAQKARSSIPSDLLRKRWVDASGGERQRLMMLSRVSPKTKALILDEPFNHLDQGTKQSLIEFLQGLAMQEDPLAIVLVSHQPSVFTGCETKVVELAP